MNIKIKKKILVCMLWLCAIACFTGFPWIFFSWDVIHSTGHRTKRIKRYIE